MMVTAMLAYFNRWTLANIIAYFFHVIGVSGVMADVLFYAASDYLHIFLT